MLIDARSFTKPENIEADICILGAGAAGLTLANELKDKFSNVVLLEAGGKHYEESIQKFYDANKVSKFYPDPKVSRLRYLGGATNHWANNTSPFSPIDFEKRSWVPNSGWPISYDDLKPFYEKAAIYCQTGNDSYQASYWLPKLKKDTLFKGAHNTELAIAKASVPPTRFFDVHGTAITDNGNVTVYSYAYVKDIEFSQVAKKVNSLLFSSYNGVEHKVHATKFIMCFGGIENARMLLHFNASNNNFLGNKFDNVGRYFMDHPTMNAAQVFATHDKFEGMSTIDKNRYIVAFCQLTQEALQEHETLNLRMPLITANEYQLSDGISSFHILKNALSEGRMLDEFGTHISNFVTDIDMVIEAIARKEFDTSIFDSAMKNIGYQIPMMVEQAPHRENRISLSRKKDSFGIPKLNAEWQLKQSDKDFIWKSLSLYGQDLGTLSIGRLKMLKERSSRLFGDQMGFGNHHMGTTRMSNSEYTGVVDGNQKVFGTNNLYIAGSSVFPTGSHVPPTLTIVATSLRLAKHIKG